VWGEWSGYPVHSILNFDYALLYSALLGPFKNEAFGPTLATVLLILAVAVFIGFLCFSVPQAIRLRAALTTIRGGTQSESDQQKRATFLNDYAKIDQALLSNKTTSGAWQEFRKNLITRRDGQRTIIINSIPAQNIFNPRSLRVQYDFVRSLPNFFVGLGLLGTFIGLIAALTFSTQDLTAAVSQAEIKDALKGLLTTAASKFYISAAGLVSFLVLSFSIRLSLKYLHGLVRQIGSSLDERLFFLNELAISDRQATLQQSSLEELKLFNTNVAMRIGDAVRTALEASNSGLNNKLSELVNTVGKLVDASRDGAGSAVNEAMKGVFDATLRQANDALGNVAASLQDLPARLSAAAVSIQNAGDTAAEQQKRLAENVQAAVENMLRNASSQVSSNIEQGTQRLVADLKDTGSAFGDSAAKIGAFFERFSTSGSDYMNSLSSLTAQNATLENTLAAISSQINAAAASVSRAGSAVDENLAKVLTGIGSFTRVAEETSRTIRESQEAVGNTVNALQQAMSQHIQRFNDVDEKLAGVFGTITSQLELQSNLMAENLSRMDQALAGAVNQFEQLIDGLIEASSNKAPV
jgi:methyl-accepting chemotaxis protein